MAAGADQAFTVERTLTIVCPEIPRIDRSPSSYRRYRHVHAQRPLGRVAAEVAVVALAKLAFLIGLGWLLFVPRPHAIVAAVTAPHPLAPTLHAPARIAMPAPLAKH
jgi:hypothetical protein